MYVFDSVRTLLLETLPSGSPLCNGTSGAPAPGSSQDPVSLRSRSRIDSNAESSVSFNNTFIQEYITSPLYVYTTHE